MGSLLKKTVVGAWEEGREGDMNGTQHPPNSTQSSTRSSFLSPASSTAYSDLTRAHWQGHVCRSAPLIFLGSYEMKKGSTASTFACLRGRDNSNGGFGLMRGALGVGHGLDDGVLEYVQPVRRLGARGRGERQREEILWEEWSMRPDRNLVVPLSTFQWC